jgi:Hint domain
MVSGLIVSMAVLAAGQPQGVGRSGAEASQGAALAARTEYLALRANTPETADGHWKLGLWCEKKGLKAEALIEFEAVSQLDPRRESAWKKLGYVKHEGRWMTPAQLAAIKAETDAQRKADGRWRPLLQKWKSALGHKDKRADAERALATVNDPRATPSIWAVFAMGSPEDQERAIDMFGHIEGDRPSRALAGLAIFGKTDLVRRAAVETLTRRKADDVMIAWIGLLRPPIKYELRQVAGPGSPGVLFVEGEQFNFRRFYAPPSVAQTQGMIVNGQPPESYERPAMFGSRPPPDTVPPDGSKCVGAIGDTALYIFDYTWAPPPPPPGPSQSYQVYEKTVLQAQVDRDFEFDEAAKMAAGAQAQLQHDVNAVEQANATIRERNARVSEALRHVAGQDLGEDRETWLEWWMKRKGFSYIPPEKRSKQTINVQVALPYVPQRGPETITQSTGGPQPKFCMLWQHDQGQPPKHKLCFATGTAVLTLNGPRAIETLRTGDLVLTGVGPQEARNIASILSVHRSQASRTIRLVVGGEALDTTEGHPFLTPGSGWKRAGDLKPGDDVQTIQGRARVEASEVREGGTVWNLRLAGSSSFLVGDLGMVVHDITPIEEPGERSRP